MHTIPSCQQIREKYPPDERRGRVTRYRIPVFTRPNRISPFIPMYRYGTGVPT